MMTPVLADLEKTYKGRLQVEYIDLNEHEEAFDRYGLTMIPTQIFYDRAGKELFRHEGFFGKDDIVAKWKELGFDLSAAAAQ